MKLSTMMLSAAAVSVILTGCGGENGIEDGGKSDSTFDQQEVRAEVRSAFAEQQEVSANAVQGMLAGLNQLAEDRAAALGPDETEKFSGSFDTVQEQYEALNPESQKALADLYRDFNPLSEFHDYEGMADAEIAIIAANALVITSATDENDADAAAEISDDKIIVEDARDAIVYYDDPDENASGTSRAVFMTKSGGDWKIDGARTFEDYIKPVNE